MNVGSPSTACYSPLTRFLALRLYPVVPANSREALCDTVLPLGGGPDGKSPVLMKKGDVAIWSLYAMHRRKDFYGPDAEEFRPERWEHLRPGWEYLPFNGGPRICIGRKFNSALGPGNILAMLVMLMAEQSNLLSLRRVTQQSA